MKLAPSDLQLKEIDAFADSLPMLDSKFSKTRSVVSFKNRKSQVGHNFCFTDDKEPFKLTAEQELDIKNGIMDAEVLDDMIEQYEQSVKNLKHKKKHVSGEELR